MTSNPKREPLDALFDAIRQEPVPNRPPDAALLARLTAEPRPAAEHPTLTQRRIVMRIVTWSLAASVLAAIGAAILLTGSPGVALADVVKATEKHKVVKYKCSITVTANPPPGMVIDDPDVLKSDPSESIIYADLRAARYREVKPEVDVIPNPGRGPVQQSSSIVVDRPKNRRLIVYTLRPLDATNVEEKGAILSTIPEAEQDNPNLTILDHLRDIETHKNALAEKEGPSVRFTVADEKKMTTLWVDAATKLPVRMVCEEDQPAAGVKQIRLEFSDFEWDPELKEFKSLDELFSLTPAEGYKLDDQTKKPEKVPAPAPAPTKP